MTITHNSLIKKRMNHLDYVSYVRTKIKIPYKIFSIRKNNCIFSNCKQYNWLNKIILGPLAITVRLSNKEPFRKNITSRKKHRQNFHHTVSAHTVLYSLKM